MTTLVAAFFAGGGVSLYIQGQTGPEPVVEERVVVRYGIEISNTTNRLLHDVSFRLFAPLKASPFHRLVSLKSSRPYEMTEGGRGQRWMTYQLKTLPPYGTTRVTVTATVDFHTVASFSDWRQPAYRRAERFIEADDVRIRDVASRLAESPDKPISRTVHDWTADAIERVNYIAEDLGARYAVQEGRGDCTEFAYTVAALARSLDVTAVPVAGFPVTGGNERLSASDYHNWSYLARGNGWALSDPEQRVYDAKRARYLPFRVLGAGQGARQGPAAQRFIVADKAVEASML